MVGSNYVVCTIESGGWLGNRKRVHLPDIPVDLTSVSEKDKNDLRFGVEQGVDMIFASFVEDASTVKEIRSVLGKYCLRQWRECLSVKCTEGI